MTCCEYSDLASNIANQISNKISNNDKNQEKENDKDQSTIENPSYLDHTNNEKSSPIIKNQTQYANSYQNSNDDVIQSVRIDNNHANITPNSKANNNKKLGFSSSMLCSSVCKSWRCRAPR